jgi:predicted ATP-dependent protease
MHLVLYQQDMNMYRYERHMEDTWEIQETNEAWLFQVALQSTKQERNILSDKTTVWGAHYIKISEDTE